MFPSVAIGAKMKDRVQIRKHLSYQISQETKCCLMVVSIVAIAIKVLPTRLGKKVRLYPVLALETTWNHVNLRF